MLKAENLVPRRRLLTVYFIVGLMALVILGRFFQLQVYRYEKYRYKADVNRIRAVSLHAPRGTILDRNGIRLVDNYPTFVIKVIPGELGSKEELFHKISLYTGIDSLLLAKNYDQFYRGKFVPARLAKDLTFAQLSILEEHKLELSGLQYDQIPERVYPGPIQGSHFLGYVKEIDRTVYRQLNSTESYELGDVIGWMGLEKQYESRLRGNKGVTFYEVDAFGRVVGKVNGESEVLPVPGNDIFISVDAKLQKILEDALQGYRGVAVAADPITGEILAYVSSPGYSPDLFTGKTSVEEWNQVLTDPDRPLLDRVTNGLYPPGSTFKVVALLALLENHLIDPNWTVECTGTYPLGDRVFRCWKEEGHGKVNLRQAVAQSCNIYFYQAIQNLTIDQWAKFCYTLGFGRPTGIDLPAEREGLIPTRDYMNTRYGKRGWSRGYMLNLAIGQGDIMVTPLQMVNFINLLATHGQTKKLHFVRDLDGVEDITLRLRPQTWRQLDRLLEAVIYDPLGTGKAADPGIKNVQVAGKTGTAENPHGDPHAWFIGYARNGDSITSVVVLIENGGHGGEVAAPVAREVFAYQYQQIGQFALGR
jgi:penicillin-binding protein 2